MAKIYEAFVDENYSITLSLYINVKNVPDLKKLLLNKKIDVSMLNPEIIVDEFHVLMAANKALSNHINDTKKTRGIHSEVIYSLSAVRGISDSFKEFAMNDDNSKVLLLEISKSGQSCFDTISKMVVGDLVNLDQLENITKKETIYHAYKIKEQDITNSTLLEVICSRMSSKEFICY